MPDEIEKRFTLRMDANLFDEISETAKKHRRSTAKEIELAIALYLKGIAEEEILNGVDTNNMNEKDSIETLKRLRDSSNKYKAYM